MKKRPIGVTASGNKNPQESALDALEAKVIARQRLIERLLAELRSLLMNKGRNTLTRDRRRHTRTKWELNAVPRLLIKGDFEKTALGGSELKIWYSPQNARLGTSATLVFSVCWQDISACSVNAFEKDMAWLIAVESAICRAMNCKGKSSRPRRTGALKTKTRATQKKFDRMKRRTLTTRARQLMVA